MFGKNKAKLSSAAILLCLGIISLLMLQCANPVSPTGGPKDTVGPKVVSTVPESQSLNFTGGELTLKFDEFIKLPTYGKDVFISPLPKARPRLRIVGKKLKIKFKEALRPKTTYVISLTGIKDANAANPMDGSFTLAFSTGSEIDSMEIRGDVVSPSGKALKEITILLFDADSIQGNDFLNKQPAYISKTDASGTFKLPFLRKLAYKIYGVEDVDQSNTYSQIIESIALTSDPLLVFSDSFNIIKLSMKLSLPDDQPPLFRRYIWLSDSVLSCTFSEGLRMDSLQISLSDTLGKDLQNLSIYEWIDGELLIDMPRKHKHYSQLIFKNIEDSLGLKSDTALRILPTTIRPKKEVLAFGPKLFPIKNAWKFSTYTPLSTEKDSLISVQDTAGTKIKIRLESKKFTHWIFPLEKTTLEKQYALHLAGELFGYPDSSFQFNLKQLNTKEYGSMKGVVQLRNYSGPIVLYFKGAETHTLQDSSFNFSRLLPGNYSLSILLDKDGNGVMTPGSLSPYRLPERLLETGQSVTIRAQWDFEDQLFEVDANGGKD